MMSKHIDIVTLTHNSAHCFERFLRGLRNGGVDDIKLIVVDNKSNDEQRNIMFCLCADFFHSTFKWLDSGYNTPYHQCAKSPDPATDAYGYSMNMGLRAAVGPYILAMNPDVFGDQEEGWLAKALELYQQHEPDIGIMGAVLSHHWGTINHAGGLTQGVHIGRHEKDTGQFDEMRGVGWVTGAFHFTRKEMFERVGYYRNTYNWASDGYTCRMLNGLGYPTYCAPVKLYHAEMESSNPSRYFANMAREKV